MLFKEIIHIAMFTEHMDEMIDFYTNKLSGELKVLTRFKSYIDRDDRPQMRKMALKNPDAIFNAYIEIAPGQSIELFPAKVDQKPHPSFNETLGYSHFAFRTDDIFSMREELLKRGVKMTSDISKGPSETWQMWFEDPDGNRFEVMQYTDNSYQVIGHLDM